jgi:hypothetical protein
MLGCRRRCIAAHQEHFALEAQRLGLPDFFATALAVCQSFIQHSDRLIGPVHH